ncbi:hypothetical protein ANCCAN_07575, partial [Ancylostoma caninum]
MFFLGLVVIITIVVNHFSFSLKQYAKKDSYHTDEHDSEPSQVNEFSLISHMEEAASTSSSFTVYLASIDYDNKFCSWLPIQSQQFTYSEETRTRTFS